MSCIVLIGGVIGCGKTTLINFIQKHKRELFDGHLFNNKAINLEYTSPFDEILTKRICTISFDDLCTIEEQEQLMKTMRGWRNFRIDLLMAAEHFINSICSFESCMAGPLTERSYKLLQKLQMLTGLNASCTSDSSIIVFVEDNFYYRSMRYEWLQIARRANIGFCQVFLHCPLSTAIHRNSIRGYHIPEEKIKKMSACIEYPDPEKYKWEKYSVLFDSAMELDASALKGIVENIQSAINNPAEVMVNEEKIQAQRICSKNVVHQADKILRKMIAKKISSFKGNPYYNDRVEDIIPIIVNIRHDLLSKVKQGSILLPEELIEKIENLGVQCVQEDLEQNLNEYFDDIWREKTMQLNIEELIVI